MTRARGIVPLGLLLAALLVATVIGAWVRALRPGDRLDDVSGSVELVEWTATLGPDGTLAARVEVVLRPAAFDALGDDVAFSLGVPEGAVRLRVDGAPAVMPSPGRTATLARNRRVRLDYQVPGAARRTDDGVLLSTRVVSSFDQFTEDYGYAEVRGRLILASGTPAADARWRLPGATVVRGDHAGPVLAVAGAASTYDDVHLVAALPDSAAPAAPASGDPVPAGVGGAAQGDAEGDAAAQGDAEGDAAAGGLDDVADALSVGRVPDGRPVPRGSSALVVAVLATVELAVLALAAAWWAWRARRTAAVAASASTADGGPDDGGPAEPPTDIAPDLVALLASADGVTVATREAVAADLLGLVDRGAIALESLDSRRFVLRIPPGPVGATAAERAIVTALRPQGQAGVATELVGPPLWGAGPHAFVDRVVSDVRHRARQAGYLARVLRPAVVGPAAAVVPLTASVGSGGDDRVTVVAGLAILAACLLGVAVSLASPLALTPAGLAARRRARAFTRAVDEVGTAGDLAAPAVLVRGPYLVYAVAVGAAPTAAADIGPRRPLVP